MELTKIHSDTRGSISILTGDLQSFEEVTIFKTNKGLCRGGCIHQKNDEFCCVIEGTISYVIGDLNNKHILNAGETIKIPKNTPHYFLSLTDSIVLEWGATAEEKKVKHPQFREIVEALNKL